MMRTNKGTKKTVTVTTGNGFDSGLAAFDFCPGSSRIYSTHCSGRDHNQGTEHRLPFVYPWDPRVKTLDDIQTIDMDNTLDGNKT